MIYQLTHQDHGRGLPLLKSALGLNEHHQATVLNYMRFARYQRGQRLKAVDLSFDDVKETRLNDDTFTVDEVTDILEGLLAVVRGDVESEFLHTSHTNVLLLRQLFQQAEKWHLKLQADISELENRELLEQIKDFEEQEFSGAKRGNDMKAIPASRLQPLNESGGSALLQMEIERLTEENEKLKDRMRSVESKALNVSQEKTSLRSDLDRTRDELSAAKNRKADYDPREVDELQRQMEKLKGSMNQNADASLKHSTRLEGDLTDTKHELLRIREMLEMAEKELEKKVSQTAPFKNLKQMLTKKNDQIKDLRKRLSKFEDDDD